MQRFPYKVVGCKPNKRNPDFCRGFIEIKGNLFKLEPGSSKKDGVSAWIRVTDMGPANRRNGSFGGGRGRGGYGGGGSFTGER